MRHYQKLAILSLCVILSACASNKAKVSLPPEFLQAKEVHLVNGICEKCNYYMVKQDVVVAKNGQSHVVKVYDTEENYLMKTFQMNNLLEKAAKGEKTTPAQKITLEKVTFQQLAEMDTRKENRIPTMWMTNGSLYMKTNTQTVQQMKK
ncbi:MAG: hypothetical protein AB7E85_09035 [Pseudobdellovibrionaceae bacterium]